MIVMAALVGVLLLIVVALTYRLWKLRQVGGSAAILRDVPAVGGHGWRHGMVRYRGGEAGFCRGCGDGSDGTGGVDGVSLTLTPYSDASPARPVSHP